MCCNWHIHRLLYTLHPKWCPTHPACMSWSSASIAYISSKLVATTKKNAKWQSASLKACAIWKLICPKQLKWIKQYLCSKLSCHNQYWVLVCDGTKAMNIKNLNVLNKHTVHISNRTSGWTNYLSDLRMWLHNQPQRLSSQQSTKPTE